MKNTLRELENMANIILATFEFMDQSIEDHVQPSYYVESKENGASAKFTCFYNDEDNKEDSRCFRLLATDKPSKLISYVQDDYEALKTIKPNF